VQIRRATVGDRDELYQLIERFYRIDNHEFEPARIESALIPLLRNDEHGQVWLITERSEEEVIGGYAVVTWSWSLESGGRDCILDELYVDRRGGGHGGMLLQRAIEEARRAGASAMFLETEAPNDGARRFYGRHGFAAEDSRWMSLEL
jgi:GNAT superfamily N-acetyltransferase